MPRTSSWIVTIAAALYGAMMLDGCRSGPEPVDDAPAPPKVSFTAAQLLQRHNERAAKLQRFHAYGVVELRWSDERGDHFEPQVDAELWIDQPNRTALRMDKLGEVLLWLGSNETQWWLFDLTATPTTLHTGPMSPTALQPAMDGATPIHPLTLLDLLGITALKPAGADEGDTQLAFDGKARTWSMRVRGRGGIERLTFDETADRLRTVEVLDDTGSVLAISTLREVKSVQVKGTNPLNWPRFPTTIVIVLPQRASSVRLALNNDMHAALEDDSDGRIFDLEALKKALQPQHIETAPADGEQAEPAHP